MKLFYYNSFILLIDYLKNISIELVNTRIQTCLFLSLLIVPFKCNALVDWYDSSLTLLRGNDFETGDKERTVLTIENGVGYSFGDHFLFIDNYRNQDEYSAYGELLARVSLNKNITSDISYGFFKDVLLALRLEHAHPLDINNQAYGVGTDWGIPGFQFFKVNFFTRRNDMLSNNELINVVWAVNWNMLGQRFVYDGFVDWVSEIPDSYTESFNITSQLKWEVTRLAKKPVYIGFEYIHWNNKFGISGLHERNLNVLVKVHF